MSKYAELFPKSSESYLRSEYPVLLHANDIQRAFSALFYFQVELDRIALSKHVAKTTVLDVAFVEEHFFSCVGKNEAKTF